MALCDLGASINLMPYTVYQQLGLTDMKPTKTTLQMADRSIREPKGVVEDVLVRVQDFIFPADFVILDIEQDQNIPLIMGRPFLATAHATINVAEGSMKLRIGNEEVEFNLKHAAKSINTLSEDQELVPSIAVSEQLFAIETKDIEDEE